MTLNSQAALEQFIINPRSFLLIFLCSVAFLAPAFLLGAGGWDLHCQSIAVKLFSKEFWDGNLYPRWLPDMFAGDGGALFFYYPPVAYYITALFHLLLPLDAFGYYPMAASAFLAVLCSGIACHIWIKEETGNSNAAVLASLLYMAAPSNLAQNFYQLLLFSSVWAYAFLPLLILSAKRVAQQKPYAIPCLALSLAALIMTNVPITIIAGPVAVAYALFHFRKSTWVKQGAGLALAILFGFALSAIYLIPAHQYMAYTSLDLEWTRSRVAREPYITGFKGLKGKLYEIYWLASLALTALYFTYAAKTRLRLFLLIVSLGALFMMQPFSRFLWDGFPVLYVVQMSERFFTVISLVLAFFAALTLPRLRFLSWGLLAFYAVITVITAADTRVSEQSFRESEPGRYFAYTLNIDQYPYYLPNTPQHLLMQRFGTPEGIKDMMQNRDEVKLVNGDAATEVKSWQPRSIRIHYKAVSPSTLQVRQFDFPGWRALLNGNDLDVSRDDPTGEIRFDVPMGEGDIDLVLTQLLPEVAGKMISMVSALLLLLYTLVEKKLYRHPGEGRDPCLAKRMG